MILDGKQPIARSVPLGLATNNVAEYEAVLRAVRVAVSQGATSAYVRTDSPVVVGQFQRPETCKAEHLRKLLANLQRLARKFPDGFRMWRIPRERNSVADLLAQKGRDANK